MVLQLVYLIIFDVNDNVMSLTFVCVIVSRASDTVWACNPPPRWYV